MLGKRNQVMDQQLVRLIKEKLDAGMFPQWLQTDPDIYQLELEKVFLNAWQYLGHESEIKNEGDYVTRWMINDPVIVVRNNKGEIKAFLNSCSHRGTHLCTSDLGNKKSFTCPYHGWTYSNDGKLIGMVAGNKVYGEDMDKEQWSLRPIPQVAVYKGLIFGNMDANAEPLEGYLGGLKWYWDIIFGRSDGGMEVRGVPQRWTVNTNWKTTLENFSGDGYHVPSTHRSTVELGISPQDPLYTSYATQVSLNNGHMISCNRSRSSGAYMPPFQGLPEEMWPMFEKNLTKEQLGVFKQTTTFVGSCFPNFSFHSPVHGAEGHLHNYLTLRVWRPLGPEKVEIWSWYLIDKAAPEWYKEASYKGYISSFGPSGTLEQDDTEIWTRVVEASRGVMARDKDLNYANVLHYMMGMDKVLPDETWVGPGVAYPTGFIDAALRNMHEHWFSLISK